MLKHQVVSLVALFLTLLVHLRQELGFNGEEEITKFLQPLVGSLDFVEVFSGSGRLADEVSQKKLGSPPRFLRVRTYDILKDPSQNILTRRGFANLVRTLLRLKVGGVCWFGVPCNTFIWRASIINQQQKKNQNKKTQKTKQTKDNKKNKNKHKQNKNKTHLRVRCTSFFWKKSKP